MAAMKWSRAARLVNTGRARTCCSARGLQTTSAASEDAILLDITGPRATITLNNPRMGNALSVDLQHSLMSRLKQVNEEHRDVRAVVLTGRGKLFCTGMNLSSSGESLMGNHTEQYDRLYSLFEAIQNSAKPVIALINGPCYGGGNGLAMACDFRVVANPNITFTLSETKLGVAPAVISKYLVREWGAAKAREAMLTARPLTAQELLPLGGVHHIATSPQDAEEYISDLVNRMVGNAPGALAECKRLIVAAASEDPEDQFKAARDVFLRMMQPSAEAKYGIEMFRKKQKPDWTSVTE